MDCNTSFKNIWLTLLFAMEYTPYNMKLNINGRPQHSFMYIEEGEYEYHFEKRGFVAAAGDLIYIPKGSVHSYKIRTEKAHCFQVEFDVNNEVIFSTYPVKLEKSENAVELLKNIVVLFDTNLPANFFIALSALYKLCAILLGKLYKETVKNSRIQPAVTYIENHYNEKFDIEFLSKLCSMSQSQLRRNFKKEYNMLPITYKNRLRIEKAKSMLLYEVANISEIADQLGFDNIYAFSNMFKKYSGLSPTQFAKNRNDSPEP